MIIKVDYNNNINYIIIILIINNYSLWNMLHKYTIKINK